MGLPKDNADGYRDQQIYGAGNFTSTYVMCLPFGTRKLCGILAGM